ncbi:MAG: SMP-30/gluconolactonase/LRE family protein [Ramlibacter sp.]|uniref:SMP-30/gluconolactonase/LRE family protein n=1 Tax=Ramlibacter sp. TaxID=1917967 RepID=UPI002630050E|nr:SMP-30/gluconolactonase/LRE family protein [Ramlibacter sp.]MDH4374907.1 SMP-30/gluconolactonase/LRE family protein [Ramlibacter sp.]
MHPKFWIRLPIAALLVALTYLLFWPIDASPVSWQPQPSDGYQGVHLPNEKLAAFKPVPLTWGAGPEHVAVGPDGKVYMGLDNGRVVRMAPDGSSQEVVADTGGRVLGFDFDAQGRLIAADAYRGLIAIDSGGKVSLLTQEVGPGDPIRYADAVTTGADGRIYFTEGSQHFAPEEWGGPLGASVAEIIEQRGSGRVLVYDPVTRRTEVIARGLVFANGIVVTQDGRSLLVVETGRYRVWRIDLAARNLDVRKGGTDQARVLLDNLPAFPDNLTRGSQGRYWLGLPQARSQLADQLAALPFLRTITLRLPQALLPAPAPYGHAIAFTEQGEVVVDLQDPSGRWHDITGVTEAAGRLYLHSLVVPALGMRP